MPKSVSAIVPTSPNGDPSILIRSPTADIPPPSALQDGLSPAAPGKVPHSAALPHGLRVAQPILPLLRAGARRAGRGVSARDRRKRDIGSRRGKQPSIRAIGCPEPDGL